MKLPGKILIVQCTAAGENRYDELVGQVVTVIGNRRDRYIIDEFIMKGPWAVYIEVKKTDCRKVSPAPTQRSRRNDHRSQSIANPKHKSSMP